MDNLAPLGLRRVADFQLTLLVLNLGFLGVTIYLIMVILLIFVSYRNRFDFAPLFYVLLICLKNWQFNLDLVLLFLFMIAKLDKKLVNS